MQRIGLDVTLHVKRALALFCKNLELDPSSSVLGQVVVVEMENLLVHESSSKLGLNRYQMPRNVLRNVCCKCGVECCFVTSRCKMKG